MPAAAETKILFHQTVILALSSSGVGVLSMEPHSAADDARLMGAYYHLDTRPRSV